MQCSGVCYGRMIRRSCRDTSAGGVRVLYDIHDEAKALTSQLLSRHRLQQTQKHANHVHPAENPILDAREMHGKAAVMAHLSQTADIYIGTRDLLHATDAHWSALDARAKASAAAEGKMNSGRHWAPRGARRHGQPSTATAFGAALGRYDAITPGGARGPRGGGSNAAAAAAALSQSWQVNMARENAAQGHQTLRAVLAQKEQCARHNEWRRVKEDQFPLNRTVKEEEGNGTTALPKRGALSTNSPLFRRYCCEFGSNSLAQTAWLTDPILYFVLNNMRVTGEESLLEVRCRAEALSRRYGCIRPQ